MAPHSSTFAWKTPWMEEPGSLQSMGLLRVRHNWATSLSLFTFMHWRRKWQPTPVSLPGESQGRGSLVVCRLWGRTESDMTEATQQQQQHVFCTLDSKWVWKSVSKAWILPLLGIFKECVWLWGWLERYICVYMCLWIFSHLCLYSSIQCLFSGQWLWLWETWREPVYPCFLVQSSISIQGLQPWSKLL